ncbi:zinc ribbon domain-containing protein [Lysinibacillus fusiformis]
MTCQTQDGIKSITIRKWICPVCGISHDRDMNTSY